MGGWIDNEQTEIDRKKKSIVDINNTRNILTEIDMKRMRQMDMNRLS